MVEVSLTAKQERQIFLCECLGIPFDQVDRIQASNHAPRFQSIAETLFLRDGACRGLACAAALAAYLADQGDEFGIELLLDFYLFDAKALKIPEEVPLSYLDYRTLVLFEIFGINPFESRSGKTHEGDNLDG